MEQGRSTSLRLGNQNKLIPRDITESLGKLPPQATDLEEIVLGTLMIEVDSITRVKYLQPHHFYLDQHAEVFRAIKQVHEDGAKPDFRMVINKLREVGKIEIVGGAHFVVSLTSNVHSAQNIDRHARIVVEMAMKRNLIQIASQIHHDAYEDTTDVFDLLKKTQEDIAFLEARETASSGPERIKALWELYQITKKPERPEPLIKIGETEVCTVGNISLLVGKKKSRKTLLMIQLIFNYLSNRNHNANEIVIFDTEQEEYDVWQVRDKIYRMTNQYVAVFCLRGLNPAERREFISMTINHWPYKLRIGVIDGIRDCMSNINDPDETTTVMSWLMEMNVRTKIHFMNILHLNKTDGNARGHIGSELLNKAEVTIEVTYDEKTTFSVVVCESSRRKPFDSFMFTHGHTFLPEIVGVPTGDGAANQDEQVKKLQLIFEDEMLKRKELEEGVKSHFAVGQNKAKQLIAQWVARGWIIKNGKDRDPKTTFKLMAQPGFTPQPVVHSQPETGNLFDNSVNPVQPPDDLPF